MRRREFIKILGSATAGVVACCARATARADAAHRRDPARSRKRCRISDLGRGVPASAGTIGLDHRPQCAHRHPLGHGQSRRNSQTGGGIGRARAGRYPGFWHLDRGAGAAGDTHSADRVPDRRRSSRRRLRRKLGAARWQRYRFPSIRIQSRREMAGAAQADRARRDESGDPSGCGHLWAAASSARSKPWRRRSNWRSARSICATPARSSAPSRHSRALQTAA